MDLFKLRRVKLWEVGSRNFITLVQARTDVEALDIFYKHHPAERGDVWKRSEREVDPSSISAPRGVLVGEMFHGQVSLRELKDPSWTFSSPKVIYSYSDVKAPPGIASQGGEGVMIYMSKIQLKMLDTVITNVMPTDTRSKMGGRMISMLHQILDGTLSKLPRNWKAAEKALMRDFPKDPVKVNWDLPNPSDPNIITGIDLARVDLEPYRLEVDVDPRCPKCHGVPEVFHFIKNSPHYRIHCCGIYGSADLLPKARHFWQLQVSRIMKVRGEGKSHNPPSDELLTRLHQRNKGE